MYKMKIQLYDPKSSEIKGKFFPEEAFFVIITEKLLKNNTKASSSPQILNLNWDVYVPSTGFSPPSPTEAEGASALFSKKLLNQR